MSYYTGKGYGVSSLTDIMGRPLLTYQGPNDRQPILLSDRVAVTKDPTIPQTWTLDELYNTRMDAATSAAVKTVVGGTSSQELDHKIPLELGGSNMVANLQLEPHISGTANTATDPLETSLSQAVQAGKTSLQAAWAAMAKAKGYTLGEMSAQGVQINFVSKLAEIVAVLNPFKSPSGASVAGIVRTDTQAQINENKAILAQNPFDLNAREKYVSAQIDAAQQKSGMTAQQAADTFIVSMQAYTQTQGGNPKDVATATGNLQNAAIKASTGVSGITGLPVQAIYSAFIRILGSAPILATAGIILILIGLAFGGPEVAAAVAALPAVGEVFALFGVSTIAGIGAGLIAIASAIVAFGFVFNMSFKEVYDIFIAAPSQTAQVFKDTVTTTKAKATTSTSSSTVSGGSSSAPHSAPSGNILISAVSSGVVGSAAAFTPRPTDIIESATDLTTAAQNNLSSYLTALPGILGYDIKLESTVVGDDGSMRFGGKNRVVKGYTKKGVAEYKTVTNKFAVLEIYYVPSPRKRVILDKIVLGPIDETSYTPAQTDLADIITHLQENFVITAHGTENMSIAPSTQLALNGQNSSSPSQTTPTQVDSTGQVPQLIASAPSACSATTLADFYARQSLSYPSLIARSALYEQAGLGTATTYTGTAEQNTKLLQHLQVGLGCFVSPAPTGQTTAAGDLSAPAATPQVDQSLLPTTTQLANRLNPIAVTVTYPTTGLFTDTGFFGESMSKRVGNTVWQLNLLSPPFTSLFTGVIGAGQQASIVDAWLKNTFGFDIMALPQFNFADLTTDRSIALNTAFNAPGQPGEGITDPKALVTLFLQTNGSPAGQTTATLN